MFFHELGEDFVLSLEFLQRKCPNYPSLPGLVACEADQF